MIPFHTIILLYFSQIVNNLLVHFNAFKIDISMQKLVMVMDPQGGVYDG